MSKKFSFLKNGSSLFLISCIIVQLIGYLSKFLYNIPNIAHKGFFEILLTLFISVKETITANWIPFSIFFVFVVMSYSLYNILIKEQENLKENTIFNTLLATVNIILCIDFFNTDALNNKIKFVTNNSTKIILFFIGLFIFIVLLIFLKLIVNSSKAKKEIHKQIQENFYNSNTNDLEEEQNDTQNTAQTETQCPPNNEILKHPFAYIYETYKYNYARRRIDASNRKIQSPSQDLPEGWGIATFLTSTIGLVILIIFVINNKNNEVFKDICNNLIAGFSIFSDSVNKMDNPLMDFLLSLGTIILLVVCFILIIFLFHFFLQTYIQILRHSKEDENSIMRFARGLKTFFFGTVDSIINLLLFVPDFLETIRESLLDNNPDDLIDTRYQKNNNTQNNNQNQP